MSDAMTNREIEDVLTSIRRLVAQEGRRPESGRLILTQAQRVLPEAGQGGTVAPDATAVRRIETTASTAAGKTDQRPDGTDLQGGGLPEPDFRRLEATIAELEAAVSASDTVWEPDGSETAVAAGQSNVTELYSKLSFVHGAMHARKGSAAQSPATAVEAANAAPVPTQPVARQAVVEQMATAQPASPLAATPQTAITGSDSPEETDDAEMFETVIDEATLRVLVAQIVREELHGQLGERITMQVRKLVRSEIAKALDDRKFV